MFGGVAIWNIGAGSGCVVAEVRFGILVGGYVVGGCAGDQVIESMNVCELMSEEMMQTGESESNRRWFSW